MARQARLQVSHYASRWHRVGPLLRWSAVGLLAVTIMAGAWRWIAMPLRVGALEFTPHSIGSIPGVRGVATGDMDDDGDSDVVVAGIEGVRIYRNDGDFSFSLQVLDDKDTERVYVADIDRDDDLDVVATFRGDSPSVRWYRNNGDLEFNSISLATAGADAVAAVGDLDADGALDIAVVSGRQEKTLERWMNDGSGGFTATTLATDTKVTTVAIADVTHDGYGDIITGGDNGLQRWSTSNGTDWIRADIDDSNANQTHLAIGDPGDGKTWIVTADQSTDEIALYRSGPSESTDTTYGRLELATGVDANTVAAVDLDRDGDLDIVAAIQDSNEVYWYENDGLDHFTKRTLATNLQSVFGVAVADFDRDDDWDIVTADHFRGTIWAYERLRKKPLATKPADMQQSTDGAGIVTFKTTLSDADRDPTRVRIQYSIDGDHWYKPWITKVAVSGGGVDLKNSQGYQIGTSDAIDTDAHDTVTLTVTWDTRSAENTGGPIMGDVGTVQLRVIPRDSREIGDAAVSSKFRVDGAPPQGLGELRLVTISESAATVAWDQPTDSSSYSYRLFYGTDHAAVLEQRSDELTDDTAALDDVETTTATITDLRANQLYTFKLFVADEFGNSTAAPSVRGRTVTSTTDDGTTIGTPTPTPSTSGLPTPTSTPTPIGFTPTPTPLGQTPTPIPSVVPSITPSISPTPTVTGPPVLLDNDAPIADAGPDQVVNPQALVVLDGTASFDPDPGDTATLSYSWRQISGQDVDLLSDRTAAARFSAGEEYETYIFSLTVRDLNGASSTDTVTVATKALPSAEQTEVEVLPEDPNATPQVEPPHVESPLVATLLRPADFLLLILSIITTLILALDRLGQVLRRSKPAGGSLAGGGVSGAQSKVVHYKTGEPIAGATVLVYGSDGKLRAQERTNDQGLFGTFLPAGQYRLGVKMEGFTFAPASKGLATGDAIVYSGGVITVKDSQHPPSVIIPLKPTASEVAGTRVRFLYVWQLVQHTVRLLSWPLFVAGALLNTVLVFISPGLLYLGIELFYVVLVITKIVLEVRMRPAYGLVRDAITHIPLELAVVRLFEQGTNRLIMTRVTNSQGKFFALPPSGTYTITITKPGYGTFTKDQLQVSAEHDTTLQLTAELMPVAPVRGGGLTQARAATI